MANNRPKRNKMKCNNSCSTPCEKVTGVLPPVSYKHPVDNKLSTTFRIALLSASLMSMVFSVYLWYNGQNDAAIYTSIWVPSILGLGNLLEN